jgi:Zn-dependent protease with chaperone function
MATVDLSFSRYVARCKGAQQARAQEAAMYAYGPDLRVRANLERLRPVGLALKTAAALWEGAKPRLLSGARRAGEQHFAGLRSQLARCAQVLGIPEPPLYVADDVSLTVHTFGNRDDATVVLSSALVDRLSEDEWMFVLGRECGHIQNGHVLYMTARHFLAHADSAIVRIGAQPAVLALNAWARRAQVTADRAGLLCGRDVGVASTALVRLAVGPDQARTDAYLRALAEAQGDGVRLAQVFATERDLAVRIAALRLFADTAYFLGGNVETLPPGALTREECDVKVADLMTVMA